MIMRFVIAFFCTLVACRGVNWKPVFHPMAWSTFDIWDNIDGTYLYFPKLPWTMRFGFVALGPIIFLMIPVYLFALDLYFGIHILMMLAYAIATLIVFTIVFSLSIVIMTYTGSWLWKIGFLQAIGKRIVEWDERRSKERAKERLAWERERAREEADLLMCYKHNFRKMKDIPRRKRTLKLRFKGTKARVCRPFPV
jgi:hypothetical protein